MNNTIKEIIESKNRLAIAKLMTSFINSQSPQEIISFFEEVIHHSVKNNAIQPIQIMIEFYEKDPNSLSQIKNRIAQEIVNENQVDMIEKAILGDIIDKKELFLIAGKDRKEDIINFFYHHKEIVIGYDWLTEVYEKALKRNEDVSFIEDKLIDCGFDLEEINQKYQPNQDLKFKRQNYQETKGTQPKVKIKT
jgi:hypothetical protein